MDVREILVPGRSMALAGHGMDGKSLMLIELTAAALSRCGRDEQPKVLVIASHQLVRCFKAELGVVEGDIEFINAEALEANQVSQSKDCETTFALLERIARLHRPNLIVLQSIESLIATPQTTRAAFECIMRRLSELAMRVHTSFLTIEPEIRQSGDVELGVADSEKMIADASSKVEIRLGGKLAKWLARGEVSEREIIRRTTAEGYTLLDLQRAREILGVRSYVRLSEGVRHRVWRLRDA